MTDLEQSKEQECRKRSTPVTTRQLHEQKSSARACQYLRNSQVAERGPHLELNELFSSIPTRQIAQRTHGQEEQVQPISIISEGIDWTVYTTILPAVPSLLHA